MNRAMQMQLSRCDVENFEPSHRGELWIVVLGVIVAACLAVAV
jgi:hypothetical protein